jgi:hypothetical protein
MRNTPVYIGEIQGAIFTSETGSFPFDKATPELTKSFPEPNLTKTIPVTVEDMAQGELLSRMVVTGNDDPVPINRGMVP